MKPNFALNLSFEGIGLLHRSEGGWLLVGEVSLDADDLAAELSELRSKAKALAPRGLKTKLVIPNEQIRYIALEAPSDADDTEARVRGALDGATPYALDDLVYDWAATEGVVTVAAVARETLEEAETFAQEHRFNPFSFVALPAEDSFAGEPFFGLTAHAAGVLDNAEAFEPDEAPIRIMGAAHMPDPDTTVAETGPAAAPAAGDTDADTTGETTGKGEATSKEAPAAGDDEPAGGTAEDTAAVASSADPKPGDDPAGQDAPKPGAEEVKFTSIRARRDDDGADTSPRIGGAERAPAGPTPMPGPQTTDDEVPATPSAASIAASLTEAADQRGTAGGQAGAIDPSMDEKQRMTIFGAREPSSAARAPRRLGIFLTLFFLFLLAAVGIWAAVSIDGGLARLLEPAQEEAKAAQAPGTAETATPSESQADASPDVPQPDSATVAPELATEENLADADNFAEAKPEPEGADIEAPAPEETSAPAMRPALDDLSPDAARARYAATGIWQRAPEVPSAPRAGDTEDIYQTSIDAPLDIRDAVALPDPNATRAGKRPPTPVSPPAPGTRFDFDERGLVRATEDGAMTPDGIRVFAGGPPVTPPPTPARPETAALADAIEIDPALATVRPRLRPDDLSELNERGFLGGRTRRELAELGPRIRPEAIGQRAQAAQATAASEPENDGDTTAAFEDPTPQAIAASLKPNTRPGDFQQIVGETRANRQSEPVSAAQRASPNIPTTASVARRATERNAMRLRRLNLIGVYGTPNSRRALVRLSNGRYRKVQVGDRLDGGRVSAIDDDRLLYTKRGRSVVLRMPRG